VLALSRWCAAEPRGDRLVAFGREGERSDADLRRDVAALAARIAPARGRDLLLYCDDAYAFAVGLLASARAGARAVLPPSRQPGALRELAGEVYGALLDSDAPDALAGRPCWSPLEAGGDGALARAPLDRDAPLAVLFTSGSTGAGRRVEKAVRHLEDEVAVLEQQFGAQLADDTRFLATVAPQHLYGLLFRVLWPLAAGRPFLRSALLHPEELAPHAEGASSFAVVSAPATLRHLAERGDLSRRRRDCRAVFSSGGPLSAEIARRTAEALGSAPWEVYGSTETGGAAVRQQHRGDEPWQPMPGVRVELDGETGCLAVTSPFVSGDGARFVTGDRAALRADGTFQLLGRADRVIKVGERRLSLPDMEERLRAHASVEDVALLALEKGPDAVRVAAVVVPTVAAWDAMTAGGRRSLAKTLSEHLAAHFERVLLPRAWRFASALPRNAQGKITQDALRAMFGADAQPDAPEPISSLRGAGALEERVRIPWDLAFLDGHFPGYPVVAGVVQVHFAMRALEQLLGEAVTLESLEELKFHAVLVPGQEAILRVELREDGARFRFSLADAADARRLFASGRGRLENPT
jgi:acyl-CoA synthetase (AMP-forming)/AMP-acid ligase II